MLIYEKRGVGPRGSRPPKSNKKDPFRPPRRSAGRTDGTDVVAAADGGDADAGPGIGGFDHCTTADVHADVVDGPRVPGVVGEEHQVAGSEAAKADPGAGAELGPADPGQPDPGAAVGGHDQAGAVVAARAGRAPHVRLAQLAPGERDRPPGGARGGTGTAEPGPRAAGPGGGGRPRPCRPLGGQAAEQGQAAQALLTSPLPQHGLPDLPGQPLEVVALGVEAGLDLAALGDQPGRPAWPRGPRTGGAAARPGREPPGPPRPPAPGTWW